jgi:hypothetical protein
MANLVSVESAAILEASSGRTAYTNPTSPVKIRLMTANGSQTAAGTEVSGGSYAAQTVTYAAASAGATSTIASSGALNYASMPACTVVGVEEWDSAGTPVRRWEGALTANKVVNSGDTFTIASGSLTKSLG